MTRHRQSNKRVVKKKESFLFFFHHPLIKHTSIVFFPGDVLAWASPVQFRKQRRVDGHTRLVFVSLVPFDLRSWGNQRHNVVGKIPAGVVVWQS